MLFATANPMPTTALSPNAKAPATAIPLCASEIIQKNKLTIIKVKIIEIITT